MHRRTGHRLRHNRHLRLHHHRTLVFPRRSLLPTTPYAGPTAIVDPPKLVAIRTILLPRICLMAPPLPIASPLSLPDTGGVTSNAFQGRPLYKPAYASVGHVIATIARVRICEGLITRKRGRMMTIDHIELLTPRTLAYFAMEEVAVEEETTAKVVDA